MSRILKVFLAVLFCSGCFCTQAVYAKSVATDLNTGIKISLKSQKGKTVITNLETRESIKVVGEYEGMTDLEYTKLLEDKAKGNVSYSRVLEDDMSNQEILSQESLETLSSSRYSVGGRYSTQLGTETSRFYLNSTTSAVVTVTQDTKVCDFLDVELIRVRDWWWDVSYGSRNFFPYTDTHLWISLLSDEYYYLFIDGCGEWTYGSWGVTW